MNSRKTMALVPVLVLAFCFVWAGNAFSAWGSKELETEKVAVNFQKEVARGGYLVVTTPELKGWIDQKK